ncbi:MAG: GntR family transcriptional regulator [Pisciglobus halotolerans]|nr:GntR family transcriptional regulator [Pisciglobus halotolerans]
MYRYREIYSDIKRNILTNHYRAGTLLPTQEVLSAKYEVFRITLKKALNLLEDEGLVYSKRGSGTYIRSRKENASEELLPLDLPVGVTYTHRDQKITSNILHFNARLPTEEEKTDLSIGSNEPVYEFKRVRTLNDNIYSYEHAVMPVSIASLNEEILKGSVYDYLGSYAKLRLTDSRRVVYAKEADNEISNALNIKIGSPVLVIEQVAYDQTGRAFESSKSYFIGTQSKFVLDTHH